MADGLSRSTSWARVRSGLLHVEANTINVWKVRHQDFPGPFRRLKSGDVWDVRDVIDWARRTGRYPPPLTRSGPVRDG